METIVVITVLCVVLITLYGAYSNILIGVNKKTHYDNTEYIYKTNLVKKFLLDIYPNNEMENYASNGGYYIYCSDILNTSLGGIEKCSNKNASNGYEQTLYKTLGVSSIYITTWNPETILESDLYQRFEATTQKYIKQLDPPSGTGFRIIVMFRSENEEDTYEYATLKYEKRG